MQMISLCLSQLSAEDFTAFQEDINSISDWVDINYLQFNVQKRKFMLVSRRN